MNKFVLLASALALVSLSACSTTDQAARDAADDAAQAAVAAQVCCDANTERLDRMYAKIMGK